jgi:hypothetical protein
MKTNQSYQQSLPATGRLILYLLVISILCFFSCISTTLAQSRTITGQVISTLGNDPLKGAAITTISSGPDIYVFTDENGHSQITLPEKTSNLIVCSWGLKTRNIPIKGRSRINIELEPENVVFEEVLVVYYQDSARYEGYYHSDQIDAIYKLQHKPGFFGFLSNR